MLKERDMDVWEMDQLHRVCRLLWCFRKKTILKYEKFIKTSEKLKYLYFLKRRSTQSWWTWRNTFSFLEAFSQFCFSARELEFSFISSKPYSNYKNNMTFSWKAFMFSKSLCLQHKRKEIKLVKVYYSHFSVITRQNAWNTFQKIHTIYTSIKSCIISATLHGGVNWQVKSSINSWISSCRVIFIF